MNRRAFLGLAGGVFIGPPLSAGRVDAQGPSKPARVGILFPSMDNKLFRPYFEGFRRRMTGLGYETGRNLTLLHEFGDDQRTRLVTGAARLRDLHPDVILAIAPAAVEVASRTTKDIPLIAVDHSTDPIEAGYVKTLAHPGGNITGIFMDFPELAGKWLDLLKASTPSLKRVALAWDPSTGMAQLNAARQAAGVLMLQVFRVEVRAQAEFDAAFRTAARQGANGLVALTSPVFSTALRRMAELALRYRMPTLVPFPAYAKSGGLIAYGPDVVIMYEQAAVMVGKVLSSTPIADIPVERPSRFTLALNVSAAKALGLTFPPSLLAQADQVME